MYVNAIKEKMRCYCNLHKFSKPYSALNVKEKSLYITLFTYILCAEICHYLHLDVYLHIHAYTFLRTLIFGRIK